MKKNFLVFGKTNLIATKTISLLKKNNFIKSYSSKECNLLNKKDITKVYKLVTKPVIMIIFSSITFEKNSKENFFKNLEMIKNIIECFNVNKIKKIVFISSVEVYGEMPTLPITENTSINPRNLYGLAKFVSEQLLRLHFPMKKLLILRLPGYYGFGDKFQSVIGKFLKSAIFKKKIVITSNGKELRDFLYADDFPLVFKNLINKKDVYGIFNLASGKSSSILSIANYINSLMNKKIKLITHNKIQTISKYKFKKNEKLAVSKFTLVKDGIRKYLNDINKNF